MDTRQAQRDEKAIQIAKQAGIEFPVTLPLFSSPPDLKAIQEWVNKHDTSELKAHFPGLKSLAEKIAKHINYIPYETFIEKLKITINDFHEKIKQEQYVLWIAQEDKHVKGGASDAWVAGLAFEHCGLRAPLAIYTTNNFVDFLKLNYICKQTGDYIKHVLLLDDASYSANHIAMEISQIHRDSLIEKDNKSIVSILEKDYQFHIGIPFMTTAAEQKILGNDRINASLLKHTQLPMLKDLLDENEANLLESVGTTVRSKTLTYFDHRFPDVYSTLSQIGDGCNLLTLGKWDAMHKMGYTPKTMTVEGWNALVPQKIPDSLPLMPTIVSPYRLHDETWQGTFKNALEKRTLGIRTRYPVPERLKAVIEMLGTNENQMESKILPEIKQIAAAKQIEETKKAGVCGKSAGFVAANSQTFFKPTLAIFTGVSLVSLLLKFTDLKSGEIGALALTCLILVYCHSKTFNQTSDHTANRRFGR